jgi:predicted nucleic acid-binding protein
MGFLTCPINPEALVVADASVIINLNATGYAADIIRALQNQLTVVEAVMAELETGRPQGRVDASLLNDLVTSGLVDIVKLDDGATENFENLVVGAAAQTLDDGEAATIAYAIAHGAIALIDERKANRICAERFSEVRVGCTVDIFSHPKVQESLSREVLAAAVFNALIRGRMRVFPHHVEWVVGLIGMERTTQCASLSNAVRTLARNLVTEK